MTRPLRITYPGAFCHVTSRGNERKDIGAYFGVGESGVSQACRRVKDKIRKDKKLERIVSKIEKK